MGAATELADVLRIVGGGGLVTGDAAVAYAVNGVVPIGVATPMARDVAVRLVNHARERGWGIVPRGGGTYLEQGFPPERLDLVLSTAKLNRVVDYQPDDMTVTVEPGMTLAALGETLATHGQFLPLNPALPSHATVGGTVAAAVAGPWRAGHGTPRDWVIGLRVLGADGEEVRGGGQVVKNVAGYDLPKLYTGSFGTLGLITEVTFKVMPRPEAVGYASVALRDAAHGEALLAAVLGSDLQPSALELTHNWSADAQPETGRLPWSLVFQFLHAAEAVEWQARKLAEIAERVGATTERLPERTGERMLAGLRDLPAGAAFLARLSTVSGRAANLAAETLDVARRNNVQAAVWAHAATGQVYLAAGEEATPELADDLRALAKNSSATCVFPRLPAPLIGQIDPWGQPGLEIRLLRGIKETLDPTRLFSPGRFVGGL